MLSVDCELSVHHLAYFVDPKDLGIICEVRLCHNEAVDLYVFSVNSLRGIFKHEFILSVPLFTYFTT